MICWAVAFVNGFSFSLMETVAIRYECCIGAWITSFKPRGHGRVCTNLQDAVSVHEASCEPLAVFYTVAGAAGSFPSPHPQLGFSHIDHYLDC